MTIIKDDSPKTCTIAACARPAYARGLCQSHHKQMKEGGTLRTIRPYRPRSQGAVKFAGIRLSADAAKKVAKMATARGLSLGAAMAEILEELAEVQLATRRSRRPSRP